MRLKILILIKCLILLLMSCSVSHQQIKTYSRSEQFNGNFFININNVDMNDERDLISWFLEIDNKKWTKWINTEYEKTVINRTESGELVVTFINHSTLLIQCDGINILTDPVWSDYVGPLPYLGLKRHRNPGMRFEDLPPIDYVILSHNHYDHFDLPTLIRLKEKFNPTILVPLGDKEILIENNFEKVIELDWWEEVKLKNNQSIFFVPAQHSSQRGLFDRYHSLWGGYVITSEGGPIYFAGDTGFGPHFYQIKEKFGRMRLSLLPIGAYKPEILLKKFHISPKEAVDAHLILESQYSVGIHWGTFKQTIEDYYDPVKDLEKAKKERILNNTKFIVLKHGKAYKIPRLEPALEHEFLIDGSTR